MRRVPLNVAKEMFFTAEPIPATRAERVGIVNAVVPAADLESHTYALAHTIATRSSQAIAAFKETMRVLGEAAAINSTCRDFAGCLLWSGLSRRYQRISREATGKILSDLGTACRRHHWPLLRSRSFVLSRIWRLRPYPRRCACIRPPRGPPAAG
jgi:hypothetical protein